MFDDRNLTSAAWVSCSREEGIARWWYGARIQAGREWITRVRILVVDDDLGFRETMADLLRAGGHTVLEAADGSEGLKLMRAGPRLDLVVLDLLMPVMNGATFRWHQRSDPHLARVPVLVLSSVKDGAKSAQLLGASAFLEKPVRFEVLMAAVRDLTRR